MTSDTCFENAFGRFELSRHARADSPSLRNLRAWDAADELLLQHLATYAPTSKAKCLILNDAFGALTVSLSGCELDVVGDSFISQRAIRANLAINQIDDSRIRFHDSLQACPVKPDFVILRIPKTLALLEDQLCRYRSYLTAQTHMVASSMVKHLAPGVFKVFERLLGPVTTSLAQKKARLLFCQPDGSLPVVRSRFPLEYCLENTAHVIRDHANVFSAGALDVGTRFFLSHIPASAAPLTIADLCCGNGILGLIAAERNPSSAIDFFDESFMALTSAETNFRSAFPEREARFVAGDGMASAASSQYDLILCNPPFHQQHVVGNFIARQMFLDARRALKPGGELRIVGNRHLGYAQILRKLFGNGEVLAVNQKFVVVRSVKQR